MPTTRQTKDNGTTIKLGPTLTAEPDRVVTIDQQEALATSKDGNPAYLADTIVSFAVHENMGINLFRVLEHTTLNPVLKPHFAKMAVDSMVATETYEQLQQNLGIPLGYISPAGRCQEAMDQKLIESLLTAGSADPMTLEVAAINATFVATSLCMANVELLKKIGEGMSDAPAVTAIQTAVAALEPAAQQHLEWSIKARTVMATTLGKSKTAQMAGNAAEAAFGKVKEVVS